MRSDHDWEFLSSHGDDAPGKSLDTYSQCTRCSAMKHEYAHGGGMTSPNYPMVFFQGGPIAPTAPCAGLPNGPAKEDT